MDHQTIFLYHNDLYPDLPVQSEHGSQHFTSLRRMANDHEARIFPNSRVTVPPTLTNFQRVWSRYIFPDPDVPIQIDRPDCFSDLYEILQNRNGIFHYECTGDPERGPRRIAGCGQATDVDVRYCIIVAGFNIIFQLKNAILRRTNMFGKIDYIGVRRYDNNDIRLRAWGNGFNQNVLYLSIDVYKELDYHLRTEQYDDFWNNMLNISEQLDPQMIQIRHTSPDLNWLMNHSLQEGILGDHGELKSQIIAKLRNKEVPESVIGALYDLVIENQMRQSHC